MSTNHELRWQPLLEQWVVMSASTATRPWSGKTLPTIDSHEHITYDANCYLCPGVKRASESTNPDYHGQWSFDNDFPSLIPEPNPTIGERAVTDEPSHAFMDDLLHRSAPASGLCRVLCWSERHNATLADLSTAEMLGVAQMWQREYTEISQRSDISYVLIFENKGVETGVSNLHPHGQIYATAFLTDTAKQLRKSQASFTQCYSESLLQALIRREEYQLSLLVEAGKYFKTIVPYAARFAYETWIVPTRHVGSIDQFNEDEIAELATMYQSQARRYDKLFNRKSPNVTLLHNAPCDSSASNQHWCFHIAMQPPLRDADKLKYLAGFESGSNNIVNPVLPESAAAAMRECSANFEVA